MIAGLDEAIGETTMKPFTRPLISANAPRARPDKSHEALGLILRGRPRIGDQTAASQIGHPCGPFVQRLLLLH